MKRPKRNSDPLDEIASAFDDGMDRIDDMEKKFTEMASLATVREVQDQLRDYAEKRDKEQSEAVHERIDLVTGNLRQGIMADVGKLLQENLASWVEKSLQPMVAEIIEEQEAARDAKRKMELERWQKRLAFATALILFIVACWQTIRPQPDNARDYVRPIERLNDFTQ